MGPSNCGILLKPEGCISWAPSTLQAAALKDPEPRGPDLPSSIETEREGQLDKKARWDARVPRMASHLQKDPTNRVACRYHWQFSPKDVLMTRVL